MLRGAPEGRLPGYICDFWDLQRHQLLLVLHAGVGKSGSPVAKDIIFLPSFAISLAKESTPRVADGSSESTKEETLWWLFDSLFCFWLIKILYYCIWF